MKILVTGGNGFVGSNLVEELLKQDHEVTIISNNSEKTSPKVKKILYMTFSGIDWDYVKNQDVIFHQMANNDTVCYDEKEMMKANYHDPSNLFAYAVRHGCSKFIYASSTAIYGNEPAPYIEGVTKINPLNVYAKSKAEFDKFAMKFAYDNFVDVIGLRYCNVYGPGEESKGSRMSMIGQLLNNFINKSEIKLFEFGEQKRDWVFIDDVVQANMKALEKPLEKKGAIYNVGSGKAHTFNEIIEEINRIMHTDVKAKYVQCNFKDMYQSHTECNIEKARKELGFNPKYDLRSGIEKYYYNKVH